jgi:membrane fusion protein, multidrug efflux system
MITGPRPSTVLPYVAALAGLSFVLAGCGGSASVTGAKPPDTGPPTVVVAAVVEQPIDVTVSMPGQLDPYQQVAIYAKVTGFVRSIRVDRGSRVRAGEAMAELDAPEFEAQHAEAESRVQAAEAQLAGARAKAEADAGTYARLKAASATPGTVAGNDLTVAQKIVETDQAQVSAAVQTSEAAKQAARSTTDLERYLRITAPFDGVVSERNAHPGTLVGPGGGTAVSVPLLRVVQDERLRLVVPVPEAYVAGVREGAVARFTVPAYPGRVFTGAVSRLAGTIDVKTRTMAVEIDVPNGDGTLTPGSFCQVQWPVHRNAPSLLVPTASVTSTTDRTFVVRVRNDAIEWVDVRVGLSAGSLTEVFGDLRPGDLVAAHGTDELRPGVQVRAKGARPGRS